LYIAKGIEALNVANYEVSNLILPFSKISYYSYFQRSELIENRFLITKFSRKIFSEFTSGKIQSVRSTIEFASWRTQISKVDKNLKLLSNAMIAYSR